MEIFVDNDNKGRYQQRTWDDAGIDYSNPLIQPPIDKNQIPKEGRVLTEFVVGHKAPEGGYPQLFDIRSSAYVRFAGYPPQVTGASMRLGAHGIFSQGVSKDKPVSEDFPTVRAAFVSVKDNKKSHTFLLVENELFCGAISMDMNEGKNAELVVDNYFYMRKDHKWKEDPHTALVAYSSMLWKTEKHTPERDSDEAHDSDTLIVKYKNGKSDKIKLDQPDEHLRIRDFPSNASDAGPSEWILANEDRNPAHYADFAPALGDTNYDKRASYKVEILDSNVKTGVTLYESNPDGEYGDNIVAASTIRQDVKKAKSPQDFVRFKYKTTSFYPDQQ
jgi:glucan biosynthesis protein